MALYETREQWGSSQTDPAGYQIGKVYEVIGHHSWKPHLNATASVEAERDAVRGIQRYHVNKGWDDIGYQWLVFQSGRAYEGRGWFRTGAHTHGRNSKSVGICFVINGDIYEPTEEAWETARAICAEGVEVGALDEDYKASGHTDYSAKSCPGNKTYPNIDRLEGAAEREPAVRTPAQVIVVPTEKYDGKNRDGDRALGAVLASTYGLDLLETGDGVNFESLIHGGPARIGDWAGAVGAAPYKVDANPPGTRIAGGDRWDTARVVADFLKAHRKADMERRGVPW